MSVPVNRMPPIHPGEILAEELRELGLSARAFADALGVPHNRIAAILRGRRSITADTALRLGRQQFRKPLDLAILLITAFAVGELRLPLVWVVPVVGAVAIWLYRPRRPGAAQDAGTQP